MAKKSQMIEVENTKGDRVGLVYESALRLLSNPSNKTWALPKDSKYQFIDNDLSRKPNKGSSREETEGDGD